MGYLGAAIVLVTTAAFGGLRDAPPTKVDQLTVGEPHVSDQVSLAIDRVILADSVLEYAALDDGQKAIVVVLSVTNLSTEPLVMLDMQDNISVAVQLGASTEGQHNSTAEWDVFPIKPPSFSATQTVRVDNSGLFALQPGVPARLALIWPVDASPAAAITAGAPVSVTIYDLSQVDLFVSRQRVWGNPVAAADVDVKPDVVGTISASDPDTEISQ